MRLGQLVQAALLVLIARIWINAFRGILDYFNMDSFGFRIFVFEGFFELSLNIWRKICFILDVGVIR
jgi:hypothetical protein